MISRLFKNSEARDVLCCITACNETEAEVALSLNSFKTINMPSASLRKRLHILIFLDRQKDDEPDTPTFRALKKLLGIPFDLRSDRAPAITRENGCRVFSGSIEDIPYSLYVKGDSLLSGKRSSILLFADVAHQFSVERNQCISSVLFLDCDTRTTGQDIQALLDRLESDPECGGVTGFVQVENIDRNNIIILMQEFYLYFYAHTINKAADTLFGKCTVLAGAFSLIRYAAFEECLPKLSKIPNPHKLREVNRLELGEDRYMTTILISKGYRTKYVHQAVAKTIIPDTFEAFVTQQRRWNQSILSNDITLLFNKGKSPLLKLSGWQFIQWIILSTQFIATWTRPAATSIIIAQGWFNNICSPTWIAIYVWVYLVSLSLTLMNKQMKQIKNVSIVHNLLLTFLLNYGFICAVGNAIIAHNYLTLFWVAIIPVLLLGSILINSRDKERNRLISGLAASSLFGSSLATFVSLYAFANLDNQSWGTRGIGEYFTNKNLDFKSKIESKFASHKKRKPVSGFSKKMMAMSLWLTINLLFILIALGSGDIDKTGNAGVVLLAIATIFNFAYLPPFLMAFLYYWQTGRYSPYRRKQTN